VRALAAEVGAEFVTVDDALGCAVDGGALLHVGDGHPNARANELMAESLVPALTRVLASAPRGQ
jgi:hypothetical protein